MLSEIEKKCTDKIKKNEKLSRIIPFIDEPL